MNATIRLVLCVAVYAGAVAGTGGPGAQSTAEESLQQEKLREEVRKLRLENSNSTGVRGFLRSYGPLLTGVAAIAGVLVTIWKQNQEQARQRSEDRNQRELESRRRLEQDQEQARQRSEDRSQRELESRRRLEEKFSTILTSLGSRSEAVRAGAAVSLQTFLQPEHVQFHQQVRLVTLANLKVTHPDTILKLLVRVFEAAIRTAEKLDPAELDFSQAKLYRADLSKLDLSEVDIGFADLRRADLTNTVLRRARGYQVDLTNARLGEADADAARLAEAQCAGAEFYGANLHAAHFERANLQNARFQQARLQSAHFDDADLRGATFQEADLNDTYFRRAQLDEKALKSITRAKHWEDAHFSEDVDARLKQLAAGTNHNQK